RHPVRLLELRLKQVLCQCLVRDVISGADVFNDFTFLVSDRNDRRIYPVMTSVLFSILDNTPERLTFLDGRPKQLKQLLRHIGVTDNVVRFSNKLLRCVPGYFAEL